MKFIPPEFELIDKNNLNKASVATQSWIKRAWNTKPHQEISTVQAETTSWAKGNTCVKEKQLRREFLRKMFLTVSWMSFHMRKNQEVVLSHDPNDSPPQPLVHAR